MPLVLSADAINRAREIADSAPPVSDAKMARLRALLHGAQPAETTPAEAA